MKTAVAVSASDDAGLGARKAWRYRRPSVLDMVGDAKQ
jgi:hypothetical protein